MLVQHLKHLSRVRPELSPKFCQSYTKPEPDPKSSACAPDKKEAKDASTMLLKRHSRRKVFCSFFSQKSLTDLNINFTKFKLSTIFRSRYIQLRFPFRESFSP